MPIKLARRPFGGSYVSFIPGVVGSYNSYVSCIPGVVGSYNSYVSFIPGVVGG